MSIMQWVSLKAMALNPPPSPPPKKQQQKNKTNFTILKKILVFCQRHQYITSKFNSKSISDLWIRHTHKAVYLASWISQSTFCQWIFNTQHRGSVAIFHASLNIIFCYICATIFYPYSCLQIVEISSIEFKKFDK